VAGGRRAVLVDDQRVGRHRDGGQRRGRALAEPELAVTVVSDLARVGRPRAGTLNLDADVDRVTRLHRRRGGQTAWCRSRSYAVAGHVLDEAIA